MTKFHGVKIALLYNDQIIIYQRDNKPGLRWAGLWDLPGGGREGDETPVECVTREIKEEFGFELEPRKIIFEKVYPSMHLPDQKAVFMVANVTAEDIESIHFGSEGQRWKILRIEDYLQLEDAVKPLQGRVDDFISNKTSVKL